MVKNIENNTFVIYVFYKRNIVSIYQNNIMFDIEN